MPCGVATWAHVLLYWYSSRAWAARWVWGLLAQGWILFPVESTLLQAPLMALPHAGVEEES